jgi:hypothetical protein
MLATCLSAVATIKASGSLPPLLGRRLAAKSAISNETGTILKLLRVIEQVRKNRTIYCSETRKIIKCNFSVY